MNPDNEERGDRLKLYRRVNIFFGVFMSSLYILLGTFLLLVHIDAQYLSEQKQNWFGALLIVYGLFRMFRYFRRRKADDTNNL